jgi:phage portal protein BeeE
MTVTAEDSQLIEQLKWTAEAICGAFGVPVYMVMGTAPTYNNVQSLTQQYYSQCLQILIESIELLLDEGLGIKTADGKRRGTRFNLDDLLRMDTSTQVISIRDAVGAGVMAPNEGRRKLNLEPATGGESPYLQQQNYSLAALAERDSDKPFEKPEPAPPPEPEPEPKPSDPDDSELGEDDQRSYAIEAARKKLCLAA